MLPFYNWEIIDDITCSKNIIRFFNFIIAYFKVSFWHLAVLLLCQKDEWIFFVKLLNLTVQCVYFIIFWLVLLFAIKVHFDICVIWWDFGVRDKKVSSDSSQLFLLELVLRGLELCSINKLNYFIYIYTKSLLA